MESNIITGESHITKKSQLHTAILKVMREDWTADTGFFDAIWYGYEALKDCLMQNGEKNVTSKELKQAMKELSSQGLVALLPSYDDEFNLHGRGWYAT